MSFAVLPEHVTGDGAVTQGTSAGEPGAAVSSARPPAFSPDTGSFAAVAIAPPEPVTLGPRVIMRRYQWAAVTADFAVANLAIFLAYLFRFGVAYSDQYLELSLVLPVAWVLLVAFRRGYESRFLGTGPEEPRRILSAAQILFTVIAVLSFLSQSNVSRGYVLLAMPMMVLFTLADRWGLRKWLYRLRGRGVGLQKVVVAGRADAVVSVIDKMDSEPRHGLVAVGACVPTAGVQVSHVHGVPVLGDPGRLLDAVDLTHADVVAVVSHPDLSGNALRRLSWALEERGVELVVSPGIMEVAGERLSIRPVSGLSLLHLEPPANRGGRMLLKAIFDRTLAGLLLLLISPLMLLIALAIKLSDRGPVLFRQTRIGMHGREFTMFKLRSMVPNAEERLAEVMHLSEGNEVLFKMRRDPRVTRIGGVLRRFSLDELPQLLNVLRGDMSMVGPRPPLPAEVAGYSSDAVRRLRVRPGLTGLWQISGRSDLSWEESLRLDLRYVDNWSMAMDLMILWRTGRAVLHGSGAY